MTTNETSFFRDVHPFEALRTTRAARAGREARARTGGSRLVRRRVQRPGALQRGDAARTSCSSAEPGWQLQILATDLSHAHARPDAGRACYSQLEVNRGLPAAAAASGTSSASGTSWRAKDELRRDDRVPRAEPDGAVAAPCRPSTSSSCATSSSTSTSRPRSASSPGCARSFAPDGYLFLGGAETTLGLDDSYERVQVGRAPAYRLRAGLASATRSTA